MRDTWHDMGQTMHYFAVLTCCSPAQSPPRYTKCNSPPSTASVPSSQWRRQGGVRRGTCHGCKTLCPAVSRQLGYDDVDHKRVNWLTVSHYLDDVSYDVSRWVVFTARCYA